MILHSIQLVNYRGIARRRVDFALGGVTVVEGPNEVGKSSLAEALDLVLGELDSSKKEKVRAVQPHHHDVGPEVEVEITSGQYHFTIRKRWIRETTTELAIHSPTRNQLRGREAHDRMTEILNETHDWALWRALRIEQSKPFAVAEFSAARGLAQALDQAAGRSANPADQRKEQSLFDACQQEMGRYLTERTAKPTGDYKLARAMLDSAREGERTLAERLTTVQKDIDRFDVLRRTVAERREQQTTQQQAREELEAEYATVIETQRAVDSLAERCKTATVQADRATAAWLIRRELVADIERRSVDLRELSADQERISARFLAASYAREQAEAAQVLADQHRRSATEQEATAAELAAYCAAVEELAELTRLQREISDAQADLQSNRAWLTHCSMTAELMAELRIAHDRFSAATAVAKVSASVLTIEALTGTRILVNDQDVVFAKDEHQSHVLARTTDITVPGQVRLRITPGPGELQRAQDLDAARTTWNDLRDRARVSSLAEAEELIAQRQQHEARLTVAQSTLDHLTAKCSVDELRLGLDRREATIDHFHDVHDGPPSSILSAPARERHEKARADLETARQTAIDAQAALTERIDSLGTSRAELARVDGAIHTSQDELNTAASRLERERAFHSSDDLENQATTRIAELTELNQQHDDAVQELDRLGSQQLRARIESITAAIEALDREVYEHEGERREIKGRLDDPDLYALTDRHAEARRDLQEADDNHDAIQGRAMAAKLLFNTLAEARGEAQDRYRAPFRERIEILGKHIYGPDFSIELDDQLAVHNRTIEGVTVPYESLSGGTQEQLCVLTRLACATLVDTSSGVPALFDDTLGHSDPERLNKLATVFSSFGGANQIILLTCAPDRFRGIKGAAFVRLRPRQFELQHSEPVRAESDPEPAEHAAAIDEPAEVSRVVECLRAAAAPLGRQDILSATGLDPLQWNSAISALRDASRVVVTGQKRGTRYSLVNGS